MVERLARVPRGVPRDGHARLAEAYSRRGLVLVLGAGVSYDSGLPLWRQLLDRVYANTHDEAPPPPGLREMPAPEFASLLEERTSRSADDAQKQRSDFVAAVRRALYHDFDWPIGREIGAGNAREFMEFIEAGNSTLRAVSAMCVRQGATRFEPNHRIKAVITFNLDNLLQSHSRAKYCAAYEATPSGAGSERLILRTVERASASSRMDKISMYHVHGMLRFDKEMEDKGKHAPDRVVLTEQDYFNAFNDPTSLFSYTFLHLLREHTALFIGLSLHDENLRRLLHYSKQERVLALRAEGETSREKSTWDVRRHVALLRKSGDADVDSACEDTLRPLGVHVIWLDDYYQVPEQLAQVYGSGNAWDAVYEPARKR